MPLSCAAPIDRDHLHSILTFKKGTISRPHSGVSYSGGLGRTAAMTLGLVASFAHCREPETAERPGMRLPDEACAARLNEPSDEACADHARHVPHG